MNHQARESDHQALRTKLLDLLQAADAESAEQLNDDTSLIQSGRLDSLGLFNLATFVERHAGRKVDFTSFDLSAEWETVAGVLDFIERLRTGE